MNWSIAEAGKYKNKEKDWQKEMRKGWMGICLGGCKNKKDYLWKEKEKK